MKSKLKSIVLCSLVGSLVFLASACDFTEMNTNPNQPTSVPDHMLLPAVLNHHAYHMLANQSPRNTNLWMQQIAFGGVLPDEDTYDVNENAVNNQWEFYGYGYTLKNARRLAEQAAERNPTTAGIAKIVEAWAFSVLTDVFGDIPFSEALDPAITHPAYDSQEAVYAGIFALLDEAIVLLARPAAENLRMPASDDLVYGGDRAKWTRLAHSLKARFHMRLSEAPGRSTTAQAQSALNALANGLQSNADNARTTYVDAAGARNPWHQYVIEANWSTTNVTSAHHINLLKELRDPRLPVHARQRGAVGAQGVVPGFTPVPFDPDVHFDLEDTTYRGLANGSVSGAGTLTHSAIGTFFSGPDAPLFWLTYASQKFVEAEATFLVSGAAAAEPIYHAAIRADMQRLGVAAADIDAYIASLPALTAANARREIITQKYIAEFLTTEPFNDWRRTGYPASIQIIPPDFRAIDVIPRRFPYPASELQRNARNIPANIPVGLGSLSIPVWWDSN
jgi:hypothetical protein